MRSGGARGSTISVASVLLLARSHASRSPELVSRGERGIERERSETKGHLPEPDESGAQCIKHAAHDVTVRMDRYAPVRLGSAPAKLFLDSRVGDEPHQHDCEVQQLGYRGAVERAQDRDHVERDRHESLRVAPDG
jgi:hypothetical protein